MKVNLNRLLPAVTMLALSLIFVAIVWLDQLTSLDFQWVHGDAVDVRATTAFLFLVGWVTFLCRELKAVIVIRVVSALALVWVFVQTVFYTPSGYHSPSKGTLAAFFMFFLSRIITVSHSNEFLRLIFIAVAGFGFVGLLGYITESPVLYFQGADSTGMALATALWFITLGGATFLQEQYFID